MAVWCWGPHVKVIRHPACDFQFDPFYMHAAMFHKSHKFILWVSDDMFYILSCKRSVSSVNLLGKIQCSCATRGRANRGVVALRIWRNDGKTLFIGIIIGSHFHPLLQLGPGDTSAYTKATCHQQTAVNAQHHWPSPECKAQLTGMGLCCFNLVFSFHLQPHRVLLLQGDSFGRAKPRLCEPLIGSACPSSFPAL